METTVDLEYIMKTRLEFDIEVYKTTQSLITALAAVQQFDLSSKRRFIPNIDVSMDIEGLSIEELNESTEQLIFRGWVTSIVRSWESYRKQIAKYGFSQNMEIKQIEQRIMGDIYKIRNSFIHGSGIVGKGKKCRVKDCEVLKWFKPGDKIIFTISHVFDFLHHLGLLQGHLVVTEDPDTSQPNLRLVWLIKKHIASQSVGRRVISVEDSGISDGDPNTRSLRVLFDNGLFGVFRVEDNSFKSVEIIEGNLKFDNGMGIDAEGLYKFLIEDFPPKHNWSQNWGFTPKEGSRIQHLPLKSRFTTLPTKVIVVNMKN